MANEFNIKNGFISKGDGTINGTLTVTSISAATYSNLPPSGISGSGSTGQITFFNTSSSLSGSSQLNWDNTNRVLRILGDGGSGTASWLQITNGASGVNPGDGMLIGYGTDNNARISLQDANSLILSNSSGDALVLNTGNVSSVNNHIIGGSISSLNTGTRFQIESPGSGSSDYPFRVNGLASSKIHFMNGAGQVGLYKSSTTLGAMLDISASGTLSTDIAFRVRNSTDSADIFTINGNGDIGVNTSNPTERLDVSGKTKTTSLQVTSGATSGYVLTSDASGNAFWQASSGINIYNSNGTLSLDRTIQTNGKNLVIEDQVGTTNFNSLIQDTLGNYSTRNQKFDTISYEIQGSEYTQLQQTDTQIKLLAGDGIINKDITLTSGGVSINSEYTLPNTDGTSGQVLTTDGNGVVSWQPSTITTLSSTTATIHFTGNTVFGSYSSPLSSNLTDTLTNAKLGVVQKIYHNSGTAPTVPAGWVLLGSTTYQTSTLNIIYAEWSEVSRVEYWIVR